MPRVFISHATADRDFIEREIIPLLQRNGVETWYARDDIGAADEWERTILQGLRSCDYFLVVMSPQSARSRWVKREVDWAFHKGEKPVVPVLLADCDSDDFHIGLAGIQHVDYRHDLETARSRLLAFFAPPAPPKTEVPPGAASSPTAPPELTNSVGTKLVLIPPGSFWMGSPQTEAERQSDEGPRHRVAITRPFYLGVNPVTQREFKTVMGYNPAHFAEDNDGGPYHLVEQVSWEEAVEFCRRLSALPAEQRGRRVYRLPTEAEWEYACRAGVTTPFYWGNSISAEDANFDAGRPYFPLSKRPSLGRTCGVGGYLPNEFGLYGMHGNVWEWCADWYSEDYYQHSPDSDPQGPDSGTLRVLRGGSWFAGGAGCRSAVRHALPPGEREDDCGFRVALPVS
jgi:formylglycine-generating enzyme required for sulfatase activity